MCAGFSLQSVVEYLRLYVLFLRVMSRPAVYHVPGFVYGALFVPFDTTSSHPSDKPSNSLCGVSSGHAVMTSPGYRLISLPSVLRRRWPFGPTLLLAKALSTPFRAFSRCEVFGRLSVIYAPGHILRDFHCSSNLGECGLLLGSSLMVVYK